MIMTPLDQALSELGPTFTAEIRRHLGPVKDRFFAEPVRSVSEDQNDGLLTPPKYMTEPDLREVAVGLVELALARGIDINLACEEEGSTLLHKCALLRDPVIAAEAVAWLLAHGADPNRKRDNGETPLDVAVRFGRTAVADVMRAHGGR